MAVVTTPYAALTQQAYQGAGTISLTGAHTLKCALLTGYTPNLAGHARYSDVAGAEVTSGGGYTTGGQVLTGVSFVSYTGATWSHGWTGANPVAVGQVIVPTPANGYLYRCAQAGTTGGAQPGFPAATGLTVVDNTAVWSCVGTEIGVFMTAGPVWAAATFTADHAAIYDTAAGFLIACVDFGGPVSPGGTFTLNPDPYAGWLALGMN